MQVKVYVPKIIEVPSEYLPALAKRAADSLGDRATDVSATRGHSGSPGRPRRLAAGVRYPDQRRRNGRLGLRSGYGDSPGVGEQNAQLVRVARSVAVQADLGRGEIGFRSGLIDRGNIPNGNQGCDHPVALPTHTFL